MLEFYDLKLRQSNSENPDNPDNSIKQEWTNTVNSLYSSSENSLRPFAARLLAREAALSNDTTNMLLYNKEIVKNYSSTENELPALFDLAIYYSETGNNLSKTKEYFSRMEDAYPEEDLTKMAEIILENKIDVKNFNKKELASNSEVNKFKLNNAYPNPFNPSTTISYQIPQDGFVTLKVFDILGKEVKTLVNKFETKGKYSASFNALDLASGVYIYRLTIYNAEMTDRYFSSTKKLILVK